MKTLITTLKLTFLAALIAGSPILFSGCGGGGATFKTTGNQSCNQSTAKINQIPSGISRDKNLMARGFMSSQEIIMFYKRKNYN